jgi:hypothetical protein
VHHFGKAHARSKVQRFNSARVKIEAENDDLYDGSPFDPVLKEVDRVLNTQVVVIDKATLGNMLDATERLNAKFKVRTKKK